MNIEAFILCYNESKIIEHTLNYYTRFCDKIIIIDNQSTDNSIAIIQEKFPHVLIEELDTNGEYREDVLIQIRNNRWKGSEADFVIMADMDEFIVDKDLVGQLKEMKKQNIAVPRITGYNMFSKTFPNDYKTLITNQVFEKIRDRSFDKNIVFNPQLVKEMNFGPGSHQCKPEFIQGVENQTNHSFELSLLHFKYLGREYLYEKHFGYSSRMSEVNRKFKFGWQYDLGVEHVNTTFNKIERILKKNLTKI